MENAADDEDVVRLDADEEKKQQDAEDDDDRRHADEDGRRLEGGRQDAVEVAQRAVADPVGAEVDELAQLVESDVADARAAERVADPLRLDEHDDVDDEEAEREQRPAETEAVRAASVDFHRSARHRSLPPRVYRIIYRQTPAKYVRANGTGPLFHGSAMVHYPDVMVRVTVRLSRIRFMVKVSRSRVNRVSFRISMVRVRTRFRVIELVDPRNSGTSE